MADISKPKVTVIIPCYNRCDFVAQTLNSVFLQTYSNIEIIAVDDGSTDSTLQVLKSYGSRVFVLEHPERVNKGQSAAINLALKKAEGKYIAILDSDDLWEADFVENTVKFLETHPDVGLVYCDGFAVDEHNNNLWRLYPDNHVELNKPELLLLDMYIPTPSGCLFRHSVLEKAGDFDEDMRSAQDHDMALRVSEITQLAFINKPLHYYRKHLDSQSSMRRRWDIGFKVLEKAHLRKHYGLNIRRKRLAVLHYRIGEYLLNNGGTVRAFCRFIYSGMLDPARGIRFLFTQKV